MSEDAITEYTITNEPNSAAMSAAISLARHILTAFGAYAIARGWTDQNAVNEVAGAVAVVIPASFSVWTSYKKAQALKAASPFVPNSIIRSK